MSANTENIEAKLCAYVDGDLDEQGRLEIEKHLQTNPQHRLLLDELRQTKVMMQALPREAAPAELAETLHGQLERSVLLDGVGTQDVAATMKINRWPQLMAVAAVLILATGLGVLVYVVLPKHADTTIVLAPTESEKVAADKSSSKEDGELGPVASKAKAEEMSGAKFADNPVVKEIVTPADERSDSKKQSKDKDIIAGAVTLHGPGEMIDNEVRLKSGEVASASPRRIYVVLSTDNLAATNEQVANYLTTNKIAWAPAPASVQQVFNGSRLANQTVQLRNAGDNYAANSGNTYNNTINNVARGNDGSNLTNNGQVLNSNGNPDPANVYAGKGGGMAKASAPQRDYNDNRKDDQYRGQYDLTQRAKVAGEVQSQVGGQMQVAQQQAPAAPGSTLNLNQQYEAAGQKASQQDDMFDLAKSTKENAIVTRGITREQAVLLCDSLGKLYAGQTAVVVDHDAIDALPVAAGPDQMNKALADSIASNTTQPSTTQPVGGRVEEQKTWAMNPATGLDRSFKPTTPPLATADASTTQPSVAPPAVPELAAPSTMPSEVTVAIGGGAGGGGAGAVGANQPVFTQQQAMDLNVAATTRPAEAPVEVVIVVQPAPVPAAVPPAAAVPANPPPNDAPNVAATPETPPSTQPAADPGQAEQAMPRNSK